MKQSTISGVAVVVFLMLAGILGAGAYQVDAVTAQAEELARTSAQLQGLVARFHAEVGDDEGAPSMHDEYGEDDDRDGHARLGTVMPRRRADDWVTAPRAGAGYAIRAS